MADKTLFASLTKFLCGSAVCASLSFFCAPVKASVSSITIDAATGKILSANAENKLRYPASLTKLMTLYITFDALDKGLIKMDDKLPVSRNAANRSPSKLGVRPGEKITVKTAILALIVKSANDCATVLAEGLGYSEENFAKTMTKVAHELGMTNTTFKNASGLPNKLQKTTAKDMAILGAAMYHHFPEYYKLFATKKFVYNGRTYYTHNHLLKTFAGADGMKTGFTNAAGYNIVTSAERNGKRVIAVTMGHDSVRLRDRKVAALMDAGLKKLNAGEPQTLASLSQAPAAEETAEENSAPAIYAIQVGAFSNYAKARNYALRIKKEIPRPLAKKPINIEPVSSGSAIVYRSQIVNLAKNEADNLCNRLKRTNKSCIVVANQHQELALAKQY